MNIHNHLHMSPFLQKVSKTPYGIDAGSRPKGIYAVAKAFQRNGKMKGPDDSAFGAGNKWHPTSE